MMHLILRTARSCVYIWSQLVLWTAQLLYRTERYLTVPSHPVQCTILTCSSNFRRNGCITQLGTLGGAILRCTSSHTTLRGSHFEASPVHDPRQRDALAVSVPMVAGDIVASGKYRALWPLCGFHVVRRKKQRWGLASKKSISAKGPLIEHLLVFCAFLVSFVFRIRGRRR